MEKEGTAHDPKSPHHLSDMVEQCYYLAMYGCQWNWVTGVFDDVTADRLSRINSECIQVY